jgi:hypothetical protein
LTEQDLNRLENYILAKNRLHNRYLVGHGVVCGLEVACSPCANTISVSDGYAIDSCGNDIIVCSPDTVDICKLIKACTPSMPANCAPYKDPTICKDGHEDWILAIRYLETPSRGVTPLTGSSQCACGASGAGSCCCAGKKPCGCGGVTSAASCCGDTIAGVTPVTTNLPRRGAPPTCEPTVTCEAYRYEVFRAPGEPTVARPLLVRGLLGLGSALGGELFARFRGRAESLMAMIPPLPEQKDEMAWTNYLSNMKQGLMRYAAANGGNDCENLAKLLAIAISARDASAIAPIAQDSAIPPGLYMQASAIKEENLIFMELLSNFLCSATLPTCPPPGDPRVPLARVRVRAGDCQVISVCNGTPKRKHVVTNLTLGRWLSWLPVDRIIGEYMEEMCCNLFGLRDQLGTRVGPRVETAGQPGGAQSQQVKQEGTSEHVAPSETFLAEDAMSQDTNAFPGSDEVITLNARKYQASNPISEAVARNLAAGPSTLTVADLTTALFGPINPADSGESLAKTPHAKVLAEAARPLFSAFGPLLSAVTSGLGQAGTTDAAHVAAMAAMRTELDQLRATVTAQQSTLDALRQAPPQSRS